MCRRGTYQLAFSTQPDRQTPAQQPGENREWTVKLRAARATMAMRTTAMMAGMLTGLGPGQAMCGSGV